MLAVTFEPPDRAASYLASHLLPFPLLSDPDRRLYSALSLGSGRWKDLWSPATLKSYVSGLLRGRLPAVLHGDVSQLGGDFVLDREGQVMFAHRGSTPADRPDIPRLLEAVDALRAPQGDTR